MSDNDTTVVTTNNTSVRDESVSEFMECVVFEARFTYDALYNVLFFLRYPIGVFVVGVLWEYIVGHILGAPDFGSVAQLVAVTVLLRAGFTGLGRAFGALSAWPELLGQCLRLIRQDALIKTACTVCGLHCID